MNVILFEPAEIGDEIRLGPSDRRARHILAVLRAVQGDEVRVGEIGGKLGRAVVHREGDGVRLVGVRLDHDPPPDPRLTLVIALPRPKVLNRVIASATSLGVKDFHLVNSWRVDKSYWKSPKLDPENLRCQSLAGLEQAGDTILPAIATHRFFRQFVESELDAIAGDSLRVVAHPRNAEECPHGIEGPVTLAIGPEGGFIDAELESLRAHEFSAVRIGPRVLRVETAVAAIIGRIA
jgi:16S rRNA (uracil1498-N3)-methyltransferase